MASYLRKVLNSFEITRKLFPKKEKEKLPEFRDPDYIAWQKKSAEEAPKFFSDCDKLIVGWGVLDLLKGIRGFKALENVNLSGPGPKEVGMYNGKVIYYSSLLEPNQVMAVGKRDMPEEPQIVYGTPEWMPDPKDLKQWHVGTLTTAMCTPPGNIVHIDCIPDPAKPDPTKPNPKAEFNPAFIRAVRVWALLLVSIIASMVFLSVFVTF